MPKQWDIVGVPGDMWPWDESASDFFAVIVSSGWAREKAGIYWFCPIREGEHRIPGEAGAIAIRQMPHKLAQPANPWRLFPPKITRAVEARGGPAFVPLPYKRPIARIDLMITGGRHELLPWDYGTIDVPTQRLLKRELRKFVGP